MSRVAALEALLAGGKDSPLLRFSLGTEYLAGGDAAAALPHLQAAVRQDPDHSAAWKALGRAAVALDDTALAREAFEQGIAAASRRGDRQAEKEMRVFLRRLGEKPDQIVPRP